MEVKEIAFDSEAYRQTVTLREQVLRTPLGLKLSAADLAGEETQCHFGCFAAGDLIACVVAKPTGAASRMKLRQMAVAESCRGSGVGNYLLDAVEALLHRDGVAWLELSARRVAEGFYRKRGYVAVGEGYLELGIAHVRMEKELG